MAQRILTLTAYLFRRLLLSLTGIIYILSALAFWRLFFDPRQPTPDVDYYILVIGLFGAAATFLITLSTAGRAYRAIHYPFLARLPSRVEHLVGVLLAALAFSLLLQAAVAILATFNGPPLSVGDLLEIPPLWLSISLLAAVLALHASDLVVAGWSRVYVYGLLAILLFGNQLSSDGSRWVSDRVLGVGNWFFRNGWSNLGSGINALSRWLEGSGGQLLSQGFELIFWPFNAISGAVIAGSFRPVQALAPAVLILYATILFLLAADFFATKDLYLTE